MKDMTELLAEIEMARLELDDALLQEDEFEQYYQKSIRLDKLIEEYLELKETV